MRAARLSLGAVALSVLAAGPAWAQAPAAAPAIESVVSSAAVNFRNDGHMDRALLILNNDSGADLRIYLATEDASGAPGKMKLALAKKSLVFAGGMWGQMPSLDSNGRGSLIVKAENSAIGRNKWEQALTVAWRNNEFQVVGVTYSAHDGLDPKAGGSCDLNLATGKGMRNNKPVVFAAKTIKVADWTDDSLPKECQF